MPTEFPSRAPKISNRRTTFIVGAGVTVVVVAALIAYFGG